MGWYCYSHVHIGGEISKDDFNTLVAKMEEESLLFNHYDSVGHAKEVSLREKFLEGSHDESKYGELGIEDFLVEKKIPFRQKVDHPDGPIFYRFDPTRDEEPEPFEVNDDGNFILSIVDLREAPANKKTLEQVISELESQDYDVPDLVVKD